MIDPSRRIDGGWHVVLFRWTAPGAPRVTVAGPPVTIDLDAARARWPAPRDWTGFGDPGTGGTAKEEAS